MDELSCIRQWYRYNAAIRLKYLSSIAGLPRRDWFRDDGASYPLLEIFLHVLDAYRWWFRYVYRDDVRSYLRGRLRTRIRTIDGARNAARRTTREVTRFVARLTSKDLDRVVVYTSPQDDAWSVWARERTTVRAMLWHMVEEELQHRGEMNALLWRHDVEPPVIGWDDWFGAKKILAPAPEGPTSGTGRGRERTVRE